jgi:RimJ/RimL family protein N-acetyltransferase
MNADPEVMRYFLGLLSAEQSNARIDAWRQQFNERGWSNWAVELQDSGEFIGFVGLSIPKRKLPCSPCVEIGWRLKREAWGKGYATEGAKECLRIGFKDLDLEEVVSFTSLLNCPSIKVMERIGLRNANADFEHPGVPQGGPLRVHCLYKINSQQWEHSDA